MNIIKFSKEYKKLYKQTSAKLILVRKILISDEVPFTELIDYDTIAEDGTRYPIGKGRWLQLVFLGNLGIPFCTIRSDKPAMNGMKSKWDYYNERVGDEFKIERTWETTE